MSLIPYIPQLNLQNLTNLPAVGSFVVVPAHPEKGVCFNIKKPTAIIQVVCQVRLIEKNLYAIPLYFPTSRFQRLAITLQILNGQNGANILPASSAMVRKALAAAQEKYQAAQENCVNLLQDMTPAAPTLNRFHTENKLAEELTSIIRKRADLLVIEESLPVM